MITRAFVGGWCFRARRRDQSAPLTAAPAPHCGRVVELELELELELDLELELELHLHRFPSTRVPGLAAASRTQANGSGRCCRGARPKHSSGSCARLCVKEGVVLRPLWFSLVLVYP